MPSDSTLTVDDVVGPKPSVRATRKKYGVKFRPFLGRQLKEKLPAWLTRRLSSHQPAEQSFDDEDIPATFQPHLHLVAWSLDGTELGHVCLTYEESFSFNLAASGPTAVLVEVYLFDLRADNPLRRLCKMLIVLA